LVYGPGSRKTLFLKLAQAKGYKTQDGLAMLLHQGARAFEIWTAHAAPLAQMKKALLNKKN